MRIERLACVYVELAGAVADEVLEELKLLSELLRAAAGGEDAWVARTDVDRERLRLFRHAVPECVNTLIDRRRRDTPWYRQAGVRYGGAKRILRDVMKLYRDGIGKAGLQSAVWGNIGDNHLHVNILPRGEREYARGKELFALWARAVSAMGGSVSAERGVGETKARLPA